MDKLSFWDRQRILRFAAIMVIIMVLTVMVALTAMNHLDSLIRDKLIGTYEEIFTSYGIGIDYRTVRLRTMSSVTFNDLSVTSETADQPLLSTDTLTVSYRLYDLLTAGGKRRVDVYVDFDGLDLRLDGDEIRNIAEFFSELFSMFKVNEQFYLHLASDDASVEVDMSEDSRIAGTFSSLSAVMANRALTFTAGSVSITADIPGLGEPVALSSAVDGSLAFGSQDGSVDLHGSTITYGSLELDGLEIAARMGESLFSADILLDTLASHIVFDPESRMVSVEAAADLLDLKQYPIEEFLSLPDGFSTEQIPVISGDIAADYGLEDGKFTYRVSVGTDGINVTDDIQLGHTTVEAEGDTSFLQVDRLLTQYETYQLDFSGRLEEYQILTPTGTLSLTDLSDGSLLAGIDMASGDDGLNLEIRSDLLPQAAISTAAEISAEQVSLSGDFTISEQVFPFAAEIDIAQQKVSADIREGTALVTAQLEGGAVLLAGSLQGYEIGPAVIREAGFLGSFTDLRQWDLTITDALLGGVRYKDREMTLAFDADMNPDSVVLKDMVLNEGGIPLSGDGSVTYSTHDIFSNPMIFSIELSNEVERYLLEARYEDSWLSASVDITDSRISRLPILLGDGYASGYVSINGNLDDFLVNATMSLENGRKRRANYSGDLQFDITPERFHLSSFTGEVGDVSITDADLTYVFSDQTLASEASVAMEMDRTSLSARASISADLSAYTINLNTVRQVLGEERLDFDLAFTDIVFDNEPLADLETGMTYQSRVLDLGDIEEDGFRLEYNTSSGNFTARMTDEYPISFTMNGVIENGTIDAVSEDLQVEFSLYQKLGLPLLTFSEGVAAGRLNITGAFGDLEYYGEFFGDSVVGSIPMIPEEIIIDDVYISMIGKEIIFAPFYLRSGNSRGQAALEVYIEEMIPTSMSMSLNIDESRGFPFDHEFGQFRMKYQGDVSGKILMAGDFKELNLTGTAVLSNGVVSMLPKKVNDSSSSLGNIDLSVRTGKNLTAVFPSLDLPILKATASEGNTLRVKADIGQNQFSAVGKVGIRGGEIVYFQRNFYITEGTIDLNLTQDTMDPRVSAIARLKDFTSAGDKVDIYLTVDNDSVYELSPTFSSSPALSIEEISRILGNNIIPEDFTWSNDITTALAVATLATDVIQQVGIIDINPIEDLELSIRNALNLDLFSIRSQVLQNIVLDTIPGDFNSTITRNPIARYLDNTTIFLGKYITEDMFLQAIMQFTIDEDTNSGLFITDDIGLDIEVSYEWTNPLNTLTISMAPASFTTKDILDSLSIGMSWSLAF